MRRLFLLVALSMMTVLMLAPAAGAQDGGLPTDQYGCVPQQQYVPEAGGCVAIEGLTPGSVPDVIDPETGESLGPITDFVTPPTEQYDPVTDTSQAVAQPETSTATASAALPATGGPSLLVPVAGLLVLGVGILAAGLARRSR